MNSVRIVGDRSGRVWPQVLRTVAESRKAGHRVVLYVPEQYTLQAEQDLITGLDLPGLLEISVVSPRKLRMNVREQTGTSVRSPLSETGRAMAVHRVMTEKAEELAYYRNMADLPGAVKRVGQALDELRESELTPEELAAYAAQAPTGAERAKLEDLKAIWNGYETLISEQFDDEKAVWTDTVNRLALSGMWEGADLAVYGFDSVRPDLRELLVRLCGRTGSTAVFLTMDREETPDGRIFVQQHESVRRLADALEENGCRAEMIFPRAERTGCEEALKWLDRNLFASAPEKWDRHPGETLRLYAAASPWEEAENVAATLRKWHGEGIGWEKMAVALPGETGLESMLRANLRINGIPFADQQKDAAADHPVCRMLLSALSCLSDGYRTEQVLAVARSGFSTLSEEEGLALEDYAAARGIEGRMWQKPFSRGGDAQEAEKLRLKLTGPIEKLRAALRNARTSEASAEAVAEFLEDEKVWERLQEEEEGLLNHGLYRRAVINRQIWKLLTELLEQLRTLLGKRRAAMKDLKNMLNSALSAAELASLPERENGVIIGEVGHLLAGDIEGLILPCAQDGMLTAPESGWLTDPERRRLEESTGKPLGISREKGCLIRKYDFYRTLTLPRKRLMISRSLRTEDGGALQPDGLTEQIIGLFTGLEEEGGVTEEGRRAEPVTPRAALDALGPWLADLKGGKIPDLPGEWKKALIQLLYTGEYGPTVRLMLRQMLPEEERQRLRRETAGRLFMTDRLSISRLERFAACPYRHFIDYGLRPVKKETFDFESEDAGTFFHEALDRFIKRASEAEGWPRIPEEQADGIMDAVLAELSETWKDTPLGADALGEWRGAEYMRRARRAAKVLTRFAANSDFRTIATEQAFGDGEQIPPVVLKLEDGSRAEIRGKIDRIDTYENGEGVWLRVVDNKSREKKPDPARMETGEQLQLMIYLKAAAASRPGTRLAGALYFPVEDREVSTPGDDPEQIEEERIKYSRMRGIVTAREDVIRAMDRDIRPYSVDKVFNKDGSVSKSAGWAVDEETLGKMTEAAVEKAAELCSRMRDGEIAPAPYEDRNDSACRYCDYRAVCRAGKDSGRPRPSGKNTLRESEK